MHLVAMASLNNILTHKYIRFMLLFVGLYLLLFYATIFWIGVMAKGNLYWAFADRHLDYISSFRAFLLQSSKLVCSLFGYEATINGPYEMRIVGGSGIRLVYSCLGYGVMSFYSAFILAWPQTSLNKKWIPLIFGLVMIVTLNILRLAFLPIIYTENPKAKGFPIDHHDIFNTIVYGVIAAMLYLWTRSINRRRE